MLRGMKRTKKRKEKHFGTYYRPRNLLRTDVLRKWLDAEGITQNELARKVRVTDTTVRKWMNGESNPNDTSAKAVSRYFQRATSTTKHNVEEAIFDHLFGYMQDYGYEPRSDNSADDYLHLLRHDNYPDLPEDPRPTLEEVSVDPDEHNDIQVQKRWLFAIEDETRAQFDICREVLGEAIRLLRGLQDPEAISELEIDVRLLIAHLRTCVALLEEYVADKERFEEVNGVLNRVRLDAPWILSAVSSTAAVIALFLTSG